MKKRYLKLIAGLMCFKNVQPISHYRWAIFLASRMKALLVLKDLQPNRPDKANYLANHKKLALAVAGCATAEASPPPTIPTAGQALRRRQPHTAAEPVNPRSPLCVGFHCRVIPFLGLAVVHRRGALRAAWSTWSRNDFHRKSTVRGEADS